MIFGDRLAPAAGIQPAAWLHESVDFGTGRVRGLLPTHYESYVLVEAAPTQPDWWDAQRRILNTVASVLADFTDTPDRSWFAIWEGHGYDGHHTSLYEAGDPPPEEPADNEAQQSARRPDDARHNSSVSESLRQIPRFELPDRTYYLLTASVADVDALRWPGDRHWFRPDLWWPSDRQWFLGTDVDFWCNYVGGSEAMAEALIATLPNVCRPVSLDDPLRMED